jgi:NADH-quinone oxidoreductase subunit M
MYQRVMLGETDKEENKLLKDIDSREIAMLIPIALFVVWIGIYPSAFLNKTQQSARDLLEQVEQGRAAWRSTLSTVPADLSSPTASGDEEEAAAR